MYSNFLFLLLIFLLPSLASGEQSFLVQSPATAFFIGNVGYLCMLLLIIGQNRILKKSLPANKNRMLFIVNLQLISFFTFYFYGLGAHRYLGVNPDYQFAYSCLAVGLYLAALWVFHYTCTQIRGKAARGYANKQLLFLIPFVIPFLLLTLFMDLFITNNKTLEDYLGSLSTFNASFLLIGITMGFIMLIMIFFPFFIQRIWQCKDLREDYPELADRLETLCARAHFKHAGLKTWTVLNDSLTAAIIGIVPRFRYIVFTKRILKLLSPDAVEAVLAHEIGHSYRKHLLIYPLIIFGMIFLLFVFSFYSEDALHPLVFFALYVLLMVVYLRFVFGFFSRNFERQADCHVFKLGIDPQYMIEALNSVAVASGNIHLLPSWHHYSIRQRIDFLENAGKNPDLIKQHDRFVRKALFIYLIFLALLIIVYYLIT